jgi:RNA methyltransferase, RsmD family
MRVITGSARGRKLKTPVGYDVRPTTDSVKEAVFNIIQADIEGRKVLDLFAGTGQLGIEALSRGAESAVFIDSDSESLKIVKENLSLCGFKATVIKTDAVSYLENCGTFDLIFIDPPYDSGLYDKVLEKINLFDILSDGGIIIVECRRENQLPDMDSPYRKLREYNYGKIKIASYTKENTL